MDETAPLTLTPPRTSSGRRPGPVAWAVYLAVAGWLLALVAAPSLVLVGYSFAAVDDDGAVQPTPTLDNYREVFDVGPDHGHLGHVYLHAGLAAVAGAAVAVAAVAAVARRFSGDAVRWGLIGGAAAYLHWVVPRLDTFVGVDLKVFWRSVELAALTTALCLAIGYPVAFFIGRSPPPWRDRLLLLVMLPFWTSFLIRTYAWKTILSEDGLLNAGLHAAHLDLLIPASGGLLYTPTAVVIGLVYAYLPFMILPIYGSVEKLDASLLEAALDLGATPARALWSVVLPLTRSGAAAGVTLVFVPAIGMYAINQLMGGGHPQMIGDVINDNFVGMAPNHGVGAALGVVLTAMFGVVLLLTGFRRHRA